MKHFHGIVDLKKRGKRFFFSNRFRAEEELTHAVSDYAYVWYNQISPHSYNDYRMPYEARYGLHQFKQLCYKNT